MIQKTCYALVLFFLVACHNPDEGSEIDLRSLKDPLVGANKILVQREAEDIDNYMRRHGWDMEKTKTGLRIMIYQKGDGPAVETGDVVQADFSVDLINGVNVYNSETDGALEFVTGSAEVINGLEEGILRMRRGDRAKLIIPSHLAYGLLGDDKKIPKRATLIYDIKITQVYKTR